MSLIITMMIDIIMGDITEMVIMFIEVDAIDMEIIIVMDIGTTKEINIKELDIREDIDEIDI